MDLQLNGRAYLLGLLLITAGGVAGGTVLSRLPEEVLQPYQRAAEAALGAMKAPAAGALETLLRSFWVNAGACALIAAGGVGWPLLLLSAVLLLLWGLPYGCAAALLWQQAGGPLCAVLCVMLPAVVLLPACLKCWALALAGARAGLHGQPVAGYGKRAVRCLGLLLPGVLLQGWLCPLLFRIILWFAGG